MGPPCQSIVLVSVGAGGRGGVEAARVGRGDAGADRGVRPAPLVLVGTGAQGGARGHDVREERNLLHELAAALVAQALAHHAQGGVLPAELRPVGRVLAEGRLDAVDELGAHVDELALADLAREVRELEAEAEEHAPLVELLRGGLVRELDRRLEGEHLGAEVGRRLDTLGARGLQLRLHGTRLSILWLAQKNQFIVSLRQDAIKEWVENNTNV